MVLGRIGEFFGSLLGGRGKGTPSTGRGSAGRPAGKRGAKPERRQGKPRAEAPRRGRTSGEAFDQFLEAMREVSPDFDRFCRTEGDDAANEALRSIYAVLPPTGRNGRTAVARRYLVRRAADAGNDEDAALMGRLSDRQVALVARRAGLPI